MSNKDRESRLSVTMLSVAFLATLGGVAATDLNKLPGVNNAGNSARDSGNISTISESFGQDSSDHFNDFEYANSNTLSTTNSVFFLYRNSSNKVTARVYFSNLLLLHNTTILVELYKINADAAQNISALPAGSDYSFSELIADTPPVTTQSVAINELGDGEALFENLDVNAYYIARTKVANNQYLYNRTLSFSTEPTTRPSFSVQSATVHNARILLNRQSLYIPQNQPDNVALAVGYRPQVSLGSADKQPLLLQRVDRGLASYEPVILQNLESGQNYEVALYAVQGMHVTRISDIKHFRTLTSFDRSESPIVRTVNMSDGVLEVEVGNIHWRYALFEKMSKRLVDSKLFNSTTKSFKDYEYSTNKVFELRARVFAGRIPSKITDDLLGIEKDKKGVYHAVDQHFPGLYTTRALAQPTDNSIRLSIPNIPIGSNVIYRVFEIQRDKSGVERILPYTSVRDETLQTHLKASPFITEVGVVSDTQDINNDARMLRPITYKLIARTGYSARIRYDNLPPKSPRSYQVRYRRLDDSTSVSAVAHDTTSFEGVVADLHQLIPNSQYIVELFADDKLLLRNTLVTPNTFRVDKSHRSITKNSAIIPITVDNSQFHKTVRIQLVDDNNRILSENIHEVLPLITTQLSSLTPATRYKLRVMSDESSTVERVLYEYHFTTLREDGPAVFVKGGRYFAYLPIDSAMRRSKSGDQDLEQTENAPADTLAVFQYWNTEGARAGIRNTLTVNPNDIEVQGALQLLPELSKNAIFGYRYGYKLPDDTYNWIDWGRFSTRAVDETCNECVQGDVHITNAFSYNNEQFAVLTTRISPSANTLYKIVYSPLINTLDRATGELLQEGDKFVREININLDIDSATATQDGAFIFKHKLLLGRDILPGIKYNFKVVSIPASSPSINRSTLLHMTEEILNAEGITGLDTPTNIDTRYEESTLVSKTLEVVSATATSPLLISNVNTTSFDENEYVAIGVTANKISRERNYYLRLYGFDVRQGIDQSEDIRVVPISYDQFIPTGKRRRDLVALIDLGVLNPKLTYRVDLVQNEYGVEHPENEVLVSTYTRPRMLEAIDGTLSGVPDKQIKNAPIDQDVHVSTLTKRPIRTTQHEAEVDLNIPPRYINRRFIAKAYPLSSDALIDRGGKEYQWDYIKNNVDFRFVAATAELLVKGGSKTQTVRLQQLRQGTRYAVAIYNADSRIDQPLLVTTLETYAQTVRANYNSAAITLIPNDYQRLISRPEESVDLYLVLSNNSDFSTTEDGTKFVRRVPIGHFSNDTDTKTIRVLGLQPDTNYYYSLSRLDNDSLLISDVPLFKDVVVRSFRTPERPHINLSTILTSDGDVKTLLTMNHLVGLGYRYIDRYGVHKSFLRLEYRPRNFPDEYVIPSANKWHVGLESSWFEFDETTDTLTYEVTNMRKDTTYDVLFLAANPLLSLSQAESSNSAGNYLLDVRTGRYLQYAQDNTSELKSLASAMTKTFFDYDLLADSNSLLNLSASDTQTMLFENKISNIEPEIHYSDNRAILKFRTDKLGEVDQSMRLVFWPQDHSLTARVVASNTNPSGPLGSRFQLELLSRHTPYEYYLYNKSGKIMAHGTFTTP